MQQNSELAQLPTEVLRHICSFVGTAEALTCLSSTCKQIESALGLSVLNSLPPHLTLNSIDKNDPTGTPMLWAEIPVIFKNKNPSVSFHCKWRDQGWGNRKGTLRITEESIEEEQINWNQTTNRNVVAISPSTAQHQETSLYLNFEANQHKKYYIWYSVGGGGGHSLHVKDICIKEIIYDALQTSKIYNSILRLNRIRFDDMFTLDAVEYLIVSTRDEIEAGTISPTNHSSRILGHYCGMEVIDEESLASLKEIATELKNSLAALKKIATEQEIMCASDLINKFS